MPRAVFFVLAVACVIAPGIANAVTTVADVQYLDDLKTCCSSYTNANVRQFSSTITGGGGEFVARAGSGSTDCGDSTDEGVIIRENSGMPIRCWYRQFSGPVHLPWYGVKDAANDSTCLSPTTIASCDAHSVLGKAFDASKAFGDGGVVTDGRSIVLDGNIDINEKQYLSCNGPPGGSRDQSYSGLTNYYTLPNSLVLNPAHSIRRHANSRLSDCIIRPYWYLQHTTAPYIPPQSVADTVQMMRQFTGTATTCDGEACNMDNMLIIGFDICDETTKQRSILSNLLEECMINEWIHDNGGGMKLQNVIVKQYIEGSLPTGLDHVSWPITLVQQEMVSGSPTDRIVVRIDIGSGPDNLIHAGGDTVLVDGLGIGHGVDTMGDLQANVNSITGIDSVAITQIKDGDSVTDTGSAGCVPANTFVTEHDTEAMTVTTNNPMCMTGAPGEALRFGHGVAPVGGNGRWLTAGVMNYSGSLYDVTLVGASWAGPVMDSNTFTWNAGSPVITIVDTTNVLVGQYLCVTGTPPFCAVPSAFNASYFVSSDIHGLLTDGTGNIHLLTGTLAGWPLSGIAQVTAEEMGYTIVDATTVAITQRGLNGTTRSTHVNTEHIVPAAPAVVGVVPTSQAVIVSAPAQTGCSSTCGSLKFATDTRVGTAGALGELVLNPGYHTWTSKKSAGPNPSGKLTAVSDGSIVMGTPTLTLTHKVSFKLQPGMKTVELTPPGTDIPADATVQSIVDDHTVTVQTTGTFTAFTGRTVQFSGCGYPLDGTGTPQPWLGNCASTSLLSGGGNDLAQGVVCEYFHSFGNQIQIHAIDAPATNCTNSVLAGGGGLGDQLDPDSVALWLDGKATKTQLSNGRIAGATISILDTPDNGNGGGQADGVGLSNIQIPGNIILGPNSNVLLQGVHGHPAGVVSNPFIYAPKAILSTEMSGNYLPQWPIYFDDTGVLPKMFCSGNDFATPTCSQVKTAPTCPASSGCTSVSGTDIDFDVTTNGTATSVTVTLAANYPAKPICRASASTTTGGAAASASVSSVTLQPLGTTVTFKTSAAVPHIYGSCHAATG